MKKFLIAMFLGLLWAGPGSAMDHHVGIEVKTSKDVFKAGEPVTGIVTIDGGMPATFQGTFKIKIYKDGELVRESYTNTPVFLGKTDYEFQNFGITGLNDGPEDIGHWRIVVSWLGSPEASAQVEFSIKEE